MATNPYFNFYPSTITQEQLLVEDLIITFSERNYLNQNSKWIINPNSQQQMPHQNSTS